jgi:uncharacterized protein
VVFGASGRVGRRVVEYALRAGHEVRAIVRDPGSLPFQASDSVHVVVGSVFEPALTHSAIRGSDAVVSTLASHDPQAIPMLRTHATREIIGAMDVNGVHRLIVAGCATLLEGNQANQGNQRESRNQGRSGNQRNQRNEGNQPALAGGEQSFDPPHSFDSFDSFDAVDPFDSVDPLTGVWQLLCSSGLDWTLACPPALVDGERTGRYRRLIDRLPEGGVSISVEDVADFIVDALTTDEYRRARVGLAY